MFHVSSGRFLSLMLIAISIVSGAVVPSIVLPVHGQGQTPVIYLSPANTTTLPPVGTLVTFNVSVANIPVEIGSWDVVVNVANRTVLDPVSINQVENFGGSITEETKCVNGSGLSCNIADGGGIAHYAATSLVGPYIPSGNDTLFSVTFESLATSGYTSISIQIDFGAQAPALISDPSQNTINVNVQGAIFGNAANAPVAVFTWSPFSPFQYDAVTVNASLSHASGGATIVSYRWGPKSTTQNVTTLVFKTPGNQSITLTVVDSQGRYSLPVTHYLVVRQKITVDLNLQVLSLSQYNYIVPGTQILITAQIFNNGTTTVNAFNVTVKLEDQVIAVIQNTNNITLNQYANLKYTWDTTGVKPSSYTLSGTLSALPGDNNTQDKFLSVDIRIIEPLGSSLVGLSLVQFGGLTVIVLIAAAFGFYSFGQRSARKRRAKEEAL